MTRRAELLRGAAIICVALLSGCATRPQPAPAASAALALAADWPTRRAQLLAVDCFALSGRVAVAAGEQGFSAGLRWEQRAERGAIVLEGPFGMGALAIDTDAAAVRVTTGRGERYEGAQARAALEQQLGFAVPLESLRYWVRGLPAPPGEAAAADPVDEDIDVAAPRLQRLQQQGWQIDYTEYHPAPFDYQPRRLVAQNGVARVRLVIDRWGATPAAPLPP